MKCSKCKTEGAQYWYSFLRDGRASISTLCLPCKELRGNVLNRFATYHEALIHQVTKHLL